MTVYTSWNVSLLYLFLQYIAVSVVCVETSHFQCTKFEAFFSLVDIKMIEIPK